MLSNINLVARSGSVLKALSFCTKSFFLLWNPTIALYKSERGSKMTKKFNEDNFLTLRHS